MYVSPGRNYMWHVDSYDKLKLFGIYINGAIDGFSRLIVCLHAYSTNSNQIIAGYFLTEVEKRMGTAARVSADLGTENVTMAETWCTRSWAVSVAEGNLVRGMKWPDLEKRSTIVRIVVLLSDGGRLVMKSRAM